MMNLSVTVGQGRTTKTWQLSNLSPRGCFSCLTLKMIDISLVILVLIKVILIIAISRTSKETTL